MSKDLSAKYIVKKIKKDYKKSLPIFLKKKKKKKQQYG